MDPARKNITVSVSQKSYREAKLWAAKHGISLSMLVAAFLSSLDVNKAASECIGYKCTYEELIRRLNEGK